MSSGNEHDSRGIFKVREERRCNIFACLIIRYRVLR